MKSLKRWICIVKISSGFPFKCMYFIHTYAIVISSIIYRISNKDFYFAFGTLNKLTILNLHLIVCLAIIMRCNETKNLLKLILKSLSIDLTKNLLKKDKKNISNLKKTLNVSANLNFNFNWKLCLLCQLIKISMLSSKLISILNE